MPDASHEAPELPPAKELPSHGNGELVMPWPSRQVKPPDVGSCTRAELPPLLPQLEGESGGL